MDNMKLIFNETFGSKIPRIDRGATRPELIRYKDQDAWLTVKEQKVDESMQKQYTAEELQNLPKKELEAILRYDANLNGEQEIWKAYWEVAETCQWVCQKCGHTQYADTAPVYCESNACNGRKSVFKGNPNPIYRFPEVEFPIESDLQSIYSDLLEVIQNCLCLSSPVFCDIIALWILGTWKFHKFNTYPYLFLTGEIGCGKSTALELLHETCYRAKVLVAPTPAVVSRLCNEAGGTILLDEAHNCFNQKTERGSDMYSLWMSGYKSGQEYLRANQGKDEGVVVRNVYTPKAYASTRSFDTALQSRSIRVDMIRGEPLLEITDEIRHNLKEIRSKLLYYHYCEDKWTIPPINLKGRSKEIWLPLCTLARTIQVDYKPLVKLAKDTEKILIEDMSQTLKGQLVLLLAEVIEADNGMESVTLKELTEGLDEVYSIQKIGYVLKDIGVQRYKSREGRFILLDENTRDMILELVQLYRT